MMTQTQTSRSVALAPRFGSYQPVDRRCDVVICIASAHGIRELSHVLSRVDSSFPVPIIVAPHTLTRFPDCLATALGTRSSLPVRYVVDGEPIVAGTVYVSPPGCGVAITSDRRLRLENAAFPEPTTSSDGLLRSAATVYRRKVAVLLENAASLGTAEGALAVKHAGGLVLSSEEDSIDLIEGAALNNPDYIDFILPGETVAPVLESLAADRTGSHKIASNQYRALGASYKRG